MAASDIWMLRDETKVEGTATAILIRHGRDRLNLELGRDEPEIRRVVEKIRKALTAVIFEIGGE